MSVNFLQVALGVGIEAILNGDVSPDDFEELQSVAKEFIFWTEAPNKTKQEIVDGLDEREMPSTVFKSNLRAVLLGDSLELIQLKECIK